MTPKISLEELLKDQVWTCCKCGGPLYVHPYLHKLPLEGRERKQRQEIRTINICRTCTV
jgi:hypothetical protein